jgi:hypothetical protein
MIQKFYSYARAEGGLVHQGSTFKPWAEFVLEFKARWPTGWIRLDNSSIPEDLLS